MTWVSSFDETLCRKNRIDKTELEGRLKIIINLHKSQIYNAVGKNHFQLQREIASCKRNRCGNIAHNALKHYPTMKYMVNISF